MISLGNDLKEKSPWNGAINIIGLYSRAMPLEEIKKNYLLGYKEINQINEMERRIPPKVEVDKDENIYISTNCEIEKKKKETKTNGHDNVLHISEWRKKLN